MKKSVLLVAVLLIACHVFSQKTERTTVTTHNRITINTDVSAGIKSFPGWGVFPSSNENVRKITMRVTLGHPDSMAIAHWDYLDFIYARRVGGQSSPSGDIEIGRIITPYGSSFKNDWKFTWEVDVTDFSSVLRDSVEIDYMHSGYEPETLGWALTINFDIVFGPPVAKSVALTEIYKGSFPYGNPADPIENYLTPYTFNFDSKAAFGRVRIQQTGHGADRPSGCSEFCDRWREVLYNETVVDRRNLWKECASNPLYPQGGTWIYDRGHWCPGDLQVPDVIDVDAKPGTNTIRLGMQPYTATNVDQPREQIAAYFIQYQKPSQQHDVAIERIVVPSDNENFSRQNPACFHPVIEFRNLGSEPLKKLTIAYGTKGFKSRKFVWQGHLLHNQAASIVLPGEVDFKRGKNTFEATLSLPNGKKDGWPNDNTLISEFTSPKELPLTFVVQYKTNNKPEENSLFLVNSKSDTIYQRKPGQCIANEVYSDTITLLPGKYEFMLTDMGGDGLEFWANPRGGYGYLRFVDLEGRILHHFISDCGNGQFLAFHAVPNPEVDTSVSQSAFFLYPRRTKQNIELDAFLPFASKMKIQFVNDGVVYETHEYTQFKGGTLNFDLGNLSPGRYIVEIFVDGELVHRNRINKD